VQGTLRRVATSGIITLTPTNVGARDSHFASRQLLGVLRISITTSHLTNAEAGKGFIEL
jgi:hypothetical protein